MFGLLATAVVLMFDVFGLKWVQLPWGPVAILGTAVAFVISFQNNAAYERTWEARKIWGGIVNTSRTWGMMVWDMVDDQDNESQPNPQSLTNEIDEHKKTLVYRQIAWLTALRFAMRQPRPWETISDRKSNREWLESLHIPELETSLHDELKPLLSASELERVLQKTNTAAAILSLQSNHICSLVKRNLIWKFSFLQLETVLKEQFTLQGKSERIKNFPYPRQYATLSYDIVRIFVILLPFCIVPEVAKIGGSLATAFPHIAPRFVWVAVPLSAIVSCVFLTIQRVGTTGENPFGCSVNDVPISTISRAIEIDLREMLDEGSELIPEPLPEIQHIQM